MQFSNNPPKTANILSYFPQKPPSIVLSELCELPHHVSSVTHLRYVHVGHWNVNSLTAVNMEVEKLTWKELLPKIGVKEINDELDKCTKSIFNSIRQLASVCDRNSNLTARLAGQTEWWLPARDQFL